MGAHRNTVEAMERIAGGFPPKGEFPSKGGLPTPSSDQFSPKKRDIPKDHSFDPKALKPMAKMLWALSVSLGHALTSYRIFTRLKSSTISPDGLLGGRGYVMDVRDVRKKLYDACEALSAISDTVHDEINAPHWKPRMSELDGNEAEDVWRFVQESVKNLDSPEADVFEEMDSIEHENDDKWGIKKREHKNDPKSGEPKSKTPSAGDTPDTIQPSIPTPKHAAWKVADSSIPVDSEPGGPRVTSLEPGGGTGPYGSFNRDEPDVADEWAREQGVGNDYLYESEWENDLSGRSAAWKASNSAVPDTTSEPTSTEGWDFGLGYGARGQGAGGYGEANPASGSYGVWGPASGLPSDPGGKTRGEGGDTTPHIEESIDSGRNVWAIDTMPADVTEPVARSDYYNGPKGNMVSQSELPGETETNPYNADKDTPNTGYIYNRNDTPYVRWDSTTKTINQDPVWQRPREQE